MLNATQHPTAPIAARGLTFIELMFATMILGLGMIIIGSVFPVAIGEQKATIDAAAASSLERNAARTLDAALSLTLPQTTPWLDDTAADEIASFAAVNDKADPSKKAWDRFKGNLIDKADPRYAWTACYHRPQRRRRQQHRHAVRLLTRQPRFGHV
jgi:type II secretory pathway pseudopilin PulG